MPDPTSRHPAPPTGPDLAFVPQAEFLADVEALAAALEAGEWRPDHLVGIGRGGLVPGTYLSHRVGVPLLPIDVSAHGAAFGLDPVPALAAATGAGARLLLVDDINDSGTTLAVLRRRLAAAGAVVDRVRAAVLIDNLRSVERVDYRARTIDRATCKRWFVFPWEALAPRAALSAEAVAVPERLA